MVWDQAIESGRAKLVGQEIGVSFRSLANMTPSEFSMLKIPRIEQQDCSESTGISAKTEPVLSSVPGKNCL
jgi:hypothetical protein